MLDISTPTELLMARGEAEVAPEPRMRAIDQDQPEDYGRRQVLTGPTLQPAAAAGRAGRR